MSSGHESKTTPKPLQLNQHPRHQASFPSWQQPSDPVSSLAKAQQPGLPESDPAWFQKPSRLARYPSHPQEPSYLFKPQQLSFPDSMTQSKDDMQKFDFPQSRNRFESRITSSYMIETCSGDQSKTGAQHSQPSYPAQSNAGQFDAALGFTSQPHGSNSQMNVEPGSSVPKVVGYSLG